MWIVIYRRLVQVLDAARIPEVVPHVTLVARVAQRLESRWPDLEKKYQGHMQRAIEAETIEFAARFVHEEYANDQVIKINPDDYQSIADMYLAIELYNYVRVVLIQHAAAFTLEDFNEFLNNTVQLCKTHLSSQRLEEEEIDDAIALVALEEADRFLSAMTQAA
jgi:hypothetical protein